MNRIFHAIRLLCFVLSGLMIFSLPTAGFDDYDDDGGSGACGFFDFSAECEKDKEYFGDDKVPKEDRIKVIRPRKAVEPHQPWSRNTKSSLGDIQRGQLDPR